MRGINNVGECSEFRGDQETLKFDEGYKNSWGFKKLRGRLSRGLLQRGVFRCFWKVKMFI